MQFGEALKLALQSLWGNKMRTMLTLIGVVMGVASVIMVITLVHGRQQVCEHQAVRLWRGCFYGGANAERHLFGRGLLQVSEAQDHPY